MTDATLIDLLRQARWYVGDALDAHEHSDGRKLLNEIDAALSTHQPNTTSVDVSEGAGGDRPSEPAHDKDVWYRGWEIGWNDTASKWAGTGWDAYKGGCDLGAPRITTTDFSDCLDEIDDHEDGEA